MFLKYFCKSYPLIILYMTPRKSHLFQMLSLPFKCRRRWLCHPQNSVCHCLMIAIPWMYHRCLKFNRSLMKLSMLCSSILSFSSSTLSCFSKRMQNSIRNLLPFFLSFFSVTINSNYIYHIPYILHFIPLVFHPVLFTKHIPRPSCWILSHMTI